MCDQEVPDAGSGKEDEQEEQPEALQAMPPADEYIDVESKPTLDLQPAQADMARVLYDFQVFSFCNETEKIRKERNGKKERKGKKERRTV